MVFAKAANKCAGLVPKLQRLLGIAETAFQPRSTHGVHASCGGRLLAADTRAPHSSSSLEQSSLQ